MVTPGWPDVLHVVRSLARLHDCRVRPGRISCVIPRIISRVDSVVASRARQNLYRIYSTRRASPSALQSAPSGASPPRTRPGSATRGRPRKVRYRTLRRTPGGATAHTHSIPYCRPILYASPRLRVQERSISPGLISPSSLTPHSEVRAHPSHLPSKGLLRRRAAALAHPLAKGAPYWAPY
jgi:hypothetical protein